MIEFLMQVVLPILKALFVPFDIALGWVTRLGPIGALIAVGAVTGVAVNLFQKYCSDQDHLGRRRADLEKLKILARDAKLANDTEKAARCTGLAGQIGSKYAMESLKPALFSLLPLCVLAMWVDARLKYEPVRPGDVVKVVGTFEDGAAGFTHIIPNDGLVPDGAAIVPVAIYKAPVAPAPGAADTSSPANAAPQPAVVEASKAPQAVWKIRAEKEGEFPLLIRHGDDKYTVPVSIQANGGRPPEQAAVFRTESPTRDRLLSVELELREPVPRAWWNLEMQSMGIYLIAALAFGLLLRRVMGIQ